MDHLIELGSVYEENQPGFYCTEHRSSWCEHCITAYAVGADAPYLELFITGRAKAGNSDPLHVTIPIFPAFCLWETIPYNCQDVPPFGSMAVIDPAMGSQHLRIVSRIMPGESARGLQMSLLQDFDDEFDLIIASARKASRARADAPAWRCRNNAHSLRYQQLVEATVAPSQLVKEGNEDLKRAMIYSFTRWNLCLFCKVNKHNRDAVRVSPTMALLFGQEGRRDPNDDDHDFSDLVPS